MRFRMLIAGVLVHITTATALSQTPMSTEFSYQGKLTESGSAVSGTADFGFRLWNAAAGGAEVTTAVTVLGVPVEEGLFTVQLDFGAAAFNGEARWLEIGVRMPAGVGAYTPLSPRQPLSATPYAIQTRGIHTDSNLNVGINETTPLSTLHVRGSGNLNFLDPGDLSTDQVVIEGGQAWLGLYSDNVGAPASGISLSEIDNTTGALTKWSLVQRTSGNGGDFSITYGSDPAGNANARFFQIKPTGDVGIGINVPSARLHVKAIGNEDNVVPPSFRAVSEYPLQAGGTSTEYIEFKGTDINAIKDGANTTMALQQSGGQVRIGSMNIALDSPKLTVSRNTSLITNSNLAFEEVLIHDTGNAWLGLYSDSIGNVGSGITFAEYDLVSQHKWAMYARTTDNVGDFVITYGTDANPTANEKMLQIDRDGTTKVKVLEILGADVAERFPCSESVEPGQVVMIDASNPGKLCLARGAYNRCVAGVVSGAGNLPVGAILGNLPESAGAPAIALSGRVWVQCDATERAIQPGDLITTADRAGHAMAVGDFSRATGATIGKAMTALEQGKSGLVLVLINLQ